jgi:MoxR-like ATPase
VKVQGRFPLVIITTNEERTLPNAFLRRCLVLYLELPGDPKELIDFLVERAQVHFSNQAPNEGSIELFQHAAKLLVEDRKRAAGHNASPLPGQAEYLDLIRAVLELAPGSPEEQLLHLDNLRAYTLRKHESPRR